MSGEKKRNNSRISGNKTFAVFINVYLAESTAKKESRGKFFRFFPRARQKKKKKGKYQKGEHPRQNNALSLLS